MSNYAGGRIFRGVIAMVISLSMLFPIPLFAQADRLVETPGARQAAFNAYIPLVTRGWYNPARGELDPSFGGDGTVSTGYGLSIAYGRGAVLQPDGKIVVAGWIWYGSEYDFALCRLNPDGSLDTSFGEGGWVVTDIGVQDNLEDVLLQADGKIVVVGTTVHNYTFSFALARYNPDGSLDTTFDGDGIVVTDFGGSSANGQSVALQADGKIVVAGHIEAVVLDFAVARYNPDGSLDTTFSDDGMVWTDFNGGEDRVWDVLIQPDGKILVAGSVSITDDDFGLLRYNPDGSLDSSFDSDGKVTTDFAGSLDQIHAVAMQPDGKIIAVGLAIISDNVDLAVARYNPEGSLDPSFGGDGKVNTDFSGRYDAANDVVWQIGGQIVVAGFTENIPCDFAIVRYQPDGSLDTRFGDNGRVVTDFAGDLDLGYAVLVQPDGRIVVVGQVIDHGNNFGTARYR